MAVLKWGAGTHPGQIRNQNEDNMYVADGVFVVADGMGGHEAGEVASAIAVERIREALEGSAHLQAGQVVDAITDANGDIFRAAIANPGQAGMGTTVTAIAVVEDPMAGRGAPNIDDNDPIETDPSGNPRLTPVIPQELPEALVLANVGDSRTYLFRHNRLRRITVDHSYVQELVATGHITDDEARFHPRRNIITRALGIEPDVKVDWWTLPIIRGDRFVLCSDGLVDEVTDEEITTTLLELVDPQEAADRLIQMANDAGGRDNVTVVVVDVIEGDDPPDPTQELDLVPTWADDTMPLPAPVAGEPATLAPLVTDLADTANASDSADRSLSRRERRRAKKAARAGDTTDGSQHDTETATDTDGAPAKKSSRLGRLIAVFVILAALITAAVVAGAWARRGYFVDFDDDGQVTVYQGREGGLLWIEPTVETTGPARDELSVDSVDRVDERPSFSDRSDAITFVAELEIAETELPTEAPADATDSGTDSGTDTGTSGADTPTDTAPADSTPPTTGG